MLLGRVFRELHEREAQMPIKERLWGWPVFLIALWVLVLLYMPFIEKSWGKDAFSRSIVLSVLIQSCIVLFLMIRAAGLKRTALMAGGIVFLSWLIEAIGAGTGLPFGAYSYTDRIWPRLLGVPVLIPFAWLMMLPPSWAVARRLSKSYPRFIVLSALAFTAWDLFLDPQMVKWNIWVWKRPGVYFGIPWVNFAGWFLAAALITALVRPSALPERPLLLIYSVTWIMETVGLMVFWTLPGPAISGFIGMGVFVLLAYYYRHRGKGT